MFPVNAPNVLTVVRILLVPVLVVALLGETDNGDLLAAIAFDPTPVWVVLLVYGAVGITVISGIDYFYGLRRLLRDAPPGAPAR